MSLKHPFLVYYSVVFYYLGIILGAQLYLVLHSISSSAALTFVILYITKVRRNYLFTDIYAHVFMHASNKNHGISIGTTPGAKVGK
jgi:hypothetical protein